MESAVRAMVGTNVRTIFIPNGPIDVVVDFRVVSIHGRLDCFT